MFGQLNPDLANQLHAERIRSAERGCLGRRVARQRKAARRLERQAARPRAVVQPA